MPEPGTRLADVRYEAGRTDLHHEHPLANWRVCSGLCPCAGVQSSADTNSKTSSQRNDNQEDEHLDNSPLLAVHANPPSTARFLPLQLLLPHFQLIASRPRRVDIRCAFLLQQARLAPARLRSLLG